ncbi:MAG: FAD-binding oxidoreductase [Chloracidobacterium sp.]|nr:FAD-binding oxidoreductase [Chloracidobacterium sp.]
MQVKTQLEDIQNYLTDSSNMQGGNAERLFIPESTDEIAAILRDANEQGISVTISGARTGTVGGSIPFGGYVISLERLNKIKSIDNDAKLAVVEPGVILGELQKAVEADGLFYPPDPTEWSCQIGGTVATNASGARSFKYGATREYVQRLTVVLASGDLVNIRRGEYVSSDEGVIVIGETSIRVPTYERPNVRKNVSGYFNAQPLDAIDLFIGSEGTLGVITEIELSLLPKPEGFFSGIVFFDHEVDLLAFVDAARDASFSSAKNPVAIAPGSDHQMALDASLIEYFDSNALKFIAEKFPETPDAAGAIFFEQETTDNTEDALLEQWNKLLETHNADLENSWFATNAQDREKMRAFRHALPLAANERYSRSGFRKISSDMAVPVGEFRSLLKFYEDQCGPSGIDHVIFGHIGDCHLHLNLFPKNIEENERARHIYGRCIAHAIMLGGCVSAEHGIGKLKRKYLAAMMGERYLNEMADIKRAFDPKRILGRGNMFDESYL